MSSVLWQVAVFAALLTIVLNLVTVYRVCGRPWGRRRSAVPKFVRGDIPWPACPDSHRTLLYELCWYTYSFPRDDIRDWVRRPKRLLGLSLRFWVWGKRAWLP